MKAKKIKENGGKQFISIQHDDVSFNGIHYTGCLLSFITSDWEKLVIPLPILPNFKDQDGATIIKVAAEEFIDLGSVAHFIGDNEPYSLSKSKNLRSMVKQINDYDLNNGNDNEYGNKELEINQEEYYDLFDQNMNQGCISHLLNLVLSYSVGLRTSNRKNTINLTHQHIPPTFIHAKDLVDKIITLNKMALKYTNNNHIRLICKEKNIAIYKPQLPNSTRWYGLYSSIRTLLKMYNI